MFDNLREKTRLRGELDAAQAKITQLETKLEAEREARIQDIHEWGNRFLQRQGQFAIEPPQIRQPPKPIVPPSPVLNATEEAVLAKYRSEAPKYGYTEQQGEELFWAQKNGTQVERPLGDGQVEWEQ